MPEIPEKQYYRLNEVCQYTDTQPYVLRFWESEFPQLSPEQSGGGQPVYRRQDIETVLKIKQLLHEESETIAGARERLQGGGKAPKAPKTRKSGKASASATGSKKTSAQGSASRTPAPEPPSAVEPRITLRAATEARSTDAQESLQFDAVPRQRYEDALEEITHLRLELNEAETRRRKAEALTQEAQQTAEELETCRERGELAATVLEDLIKTLESTT